MRTPSITDAKNLNQELINFTHANLNKLCAIDLLTTGPNPTIHDMTEITIYPMNSKFQLARSIMPFNGLVQPQKYWRWMSNEEIKEYKINRKINEAGWYSGINRTHLRELFEEWFEKKLAPVENKKIIPLAYNWPEKRAFLVEWLGINTFNHYFHYQHRDILSIALFCNDFTDTHSQPYRMAKVDFQYICSSLRVEYDRFDTILRTKAIAEIYEIFLWSFYKMVIT